MYVDIIAIALGGILGAWSRYYIILFCTQKLGYQPFHGTFVVNLTGAMIIGFCAALVKEVQPIALPWDKLVLLGFLGSYTTFSSYILDTVNLWQSRQQRMALIYWVTTLVLGFVFTELGQFLFRLV